MTRFYVYGWTMNGNGRPVQYFNGSFESMENARQATALFPENVSWRIVCNSITIAEKIIEF